MLISFFRNHVFAIAAIAAVVFSVCVVSFAHANPLQFIQSWRTSTASTTVAFMSPGLATTTLTVDSYSLFGSSLPNNVKVDTALLAFQYTASTTGVILKMRQEFSEDNVDWYPETVGVSVSGLSTSATTTAMTLPFHDYQFTIATTTDNGGSGTAARVHVSMPISFPSRYVRFVFYVPTSGGNGALWASVIPAKQKP